MRNIETEAKERSSNVVKKDVPNCINCGFLGKDGQRTPVCQMCGMSTTIKFNYKSKV